MILILKMLTGTLVNYKYKYVYTAQKVNNTNKVQWKTVFDLQLKLSSLVIKDRRF